MAIAAIVTRGYGTPGSIALVVTAGFLAGITVIAPHVTVSAHSSSVVPTINLVGRTAITARSVGRTAITTANWGVTTSTTRAGGQTTGTTDTV